MLIGMKANPIRLLISGYGVAALASAGVLLLGGGALPAGLMLWLGGAVFTIALGAAPGRLGAIFRATEERSVADEAEAEARDDAALARALERWDDDLRRDQARAAEARRVTG